MLLLRLWALPPTIVAAGAATSGTTHPRLYYTASDAPFLRSKGKLPFFAGVLQQYEDALDHKLNYSAGGVLQDVGACSGCGWRHQLGAALYAFGDGGANATARGEAAKADVLAQVTAMSPASGSWFAGNERNLQQLVNSFDVLHPLFSAAEAAAAEAAFALNAQYMFAAAPEGLGVAPDMASRLMNPAADRLAAVGLIALAFPAAPNASKWLAQSLREFEWMLANGVMGDGAWHEPTTRYHGAVLRAFIPFAYALRQAGVIDAFNEIESFKRYVGWYRHVQTPADATMGGCSLTPALSDGNWESVWLATLGWAAGAYARTDPSYAAELWGAWERACAPMALEPSPPAMLPGLLFVGCTRAGECGDAFSEPFGGGGAALPAVRPRRSALLSGYAVLEASPSAAAAAADNNSPYFIMTTSTQRQTEGHEHPDRGSFSLYSRGVPLVLDPGVGWCGYNWFGTVPPARSNGTAFDKGLQFGAWYRGSQAHSMVNFAAEGAGIKPENETWRPAGAFGHEWGMRGAAWVDNHVFTEALDYVDLNVTRAVRASQLPGVRSYHRRVFANHREESYLLWDAVEAPRAACAQAQFNLHVVTQTGWPGVVGCAPSNGTGGDGDGGGSGGATRLLCTALQGMALDVTLLQPTAADARGLLHIEADPLPVQFTGMTGSASAAPPGMDAVGGALGGDWNAVQNVAPEDPHWPARTPTWIRVDAAEPPNDGRPAAAERGAAEEEACTGFLTLLRPRNASVVDDMQVQLLEELAGGAATVQTTAATGRALYLLGDRAAGASGAPQLRGMAAVVGWDGAGKLDFAQLVQGSLLAVPASSIRLATSTNVTLTLSSPADQQYVLRVLEPVLGATLVTAILPWSSPPTQVNVWRGAHVWHVANTSLSSGEAEPVIEFEALPGEDYLIERQCIRSMKAGYNDGKGGWLCDPDHPYYADEL
jgi:hypothetical protein